MSRRWWVWGCVPLTALGGVICLMAGGTTAAAAGPTRAPALRAAGGLTLSPVSIDPRIVLRRPHRRAPHEHRPHRRAPHEHVPHEHVPHEHVPHGTMPIPIKIVSRFDRLQVRQMHVPAAGVPRPPLRHLVHQSTSRGDGLMLVGVAGGLLAVGTVLGIRSGRRPRRS